MYQLAAQVVNAAASPLRPGLSAFPPQADHSPAMTKEPRLRLHLVSSGSGEGLRLLVRAALDELQLAGARERVWASVHTPDQLRGILEAMERRPGFVLHRLSDPNLRAVLEEGCERIGVSCFAVADPVVAALAEYLGNAGRTPPRLSEQTRREEAIQFALDHDDGRGLDDLERAEVVLVGVSRTAKTPLCLYLASRGIRTASVPLIAGRPLPEVLSRLPDTTVVGLTIKAEVLMKMRRARMSRLGESLGGDYCRIDGIRRELLAAHRQFLAHGWPVVDVTDTSIEEAAGMILKIREQDHQERRLGKGER